MSNWKLSAGTVCIIGKKLLQTDVLPTTAYIMLGENCHKNCGFCAQARTSDARQDQLSRVTWPNVAIGEAVAGIAAAFGWGMISRACLQVVGNEDAWNKTLKAVELLHANSQVPVCVSSHIHTVEQAKELIVHGAERVCIALDAATPEIYRGVKGGDWGRRWQLLVACAEALPQRVTTHLIVGLGESEMEMVRVMAACIERGVTIGLFAFTPVRGTVMFDRKPPSVGHYRRIQIAHHLLKKGYQQQVFQFDSQEQIADIKLPQQEWLSMLSDGRTFETSGCNNCNRPYYNERPGGVMYNYPRSLTQEEVSRAIAESGIAQGGDYELAFDQ
jgi:biotin synthase